MNTIHADLVEGVPFLAEAGRTITGMLMENMTPLVFVASEYIMLEAELVTSINIIKEGHVQQIDTWGKLIKTLPKGGYFGDECIKTLSCPSTWNYRAKVGTHPQSSRHTHISHSNQWSYKPKIIPTGRCRNHDHRPGVF